MSTSKICKDGASKNDGDVCEVNDMLQNMITADNDVSVCANCGKEGSNLKSCTACKLVKYCNRECQIAHRSQHKKECRKREAELHDEKLFKQPPPAEDCPICFLPLPTLNTGWRYMSCCGKVICGGCFFAPVYDNQGNEVDNLKCPFCRIPVPKTSEEAMEREKKRVEAGDPMAIYNQGVYYRDGLYGFPQDNDKALELFHRAGELGSAIAYLNIGYAYNHGNGVKDDKKMAVYYYELAAIGGDVSARYNLGSMEEGSAHFDRALNHYMIAVRGGLSDSLEAIKELYTDGHASKDDYTKALRAYQTYLGEIKSSQRDKAAAKYANSPDEYASLRCCYY